MIIEHECTVQILNLDLCHDQLEHRRAQDNKDKSDGNIDLDSLTSMTAS